MLFEPPTAQLLIIFEVPTMKILASEESVNMHYITKAVISPNGKYIAVLGNWNGNWKNLVNSLDIYKINTSIPISMEWESVVISDTQ